MAVDKLARAFGRSDPKVIPVFKRYVQESLVRSTAQMLNCGVEITTSMLQEQRVVEAIRGFAWEGIAPWVGRRK
jgi:hypothetical protein